MFLGNYIVSFSGYQTLLKDPENKSEYSNGKKKLFYLFPTDDAASVRKHHNRHAYRGAPSDKHLTHNTQSRHGGYKMQVTMTIPNWDLILNPSTRAFYTDYVGELKKVFQQKIVFVRFWFKLFLGTNSRSYHIN